MLSSETSREGTVVSVQRALEILELLQNNPISPMVAEISTALGIPEPTVHRLCQTLEAAGFIRRDPATLRYRLGLKVLSLGSAAAEQMPVRREALATAQRLAETTGLNANVGILYGRDVVYIARVDGPELPKGYCLPGRRAPAHLTAMGRVLLAHLTDAELDAWLNESALPSDDTPYAIPDPAALRTLLLQARQQRFAREEEELIVGNRCLAVPIREIRGLVVASLSLSGPIGRFDPSRDQEWLQRLLESAAEISLRLGYIS